MSRVDRLLSGPGLSIDRTFEILSDPRKRWILYTVYGSNDGMGSIDGIVDDVFALERSTMEGDVPPEYRDSVDEMVRHEHLPELTRLGIVEWEQTSDEVRYAGRYPLDEWLERVQVAEETIETRTTG